MSVEMVVLLIISHTSVWGLGWYAHCAKCERKQKAEELRLAITNTIDEHSSDAL